MRTVLNMDFWWHTSSTCVETSLLYFLPAWTLHASINSYLWSYNENICEYWGFILFSYIHPNVSFCLPSNIISMGTNLLHLFPAHTLHSSINSYLWSNNENISESRGFIMFSYLHPKVCFCLPSTMLDVICLCNWFGDKNISFLSFLPRLITHPLIAIYDPAIILFVNVYMQVSYIFLMFTTRSVFVFHQFFWWHLPLQ
jgi:hypothetical protein